MGLFENIQEEQVAKLNLREPVTARPDEKLHAAIQAMRKANLGCVIVVDEEHKPVGMFTEGMLTQLVAKGENFTDKTVGDLAVTHWPQVTLTDPVSIVLEALALKNVRFLSVVDSDGKLVGLTGQKGLMEYVADHFPQVTVQPVGLNTTMQTREGA